MTSPRELVRAGVRNLLRDYWAGLTLGHIDDSFRAAHFEPDPRLEIARRAGRLLNQCYVAIEPGLRRQMR
jgi:hypothetical protein